MLSVKYKKGNPSPVTKFQDDVRLHLLNHFNTEVLCECRSRMSKMIYSPRLDVAVGPFAMEDGVRFDREYEEMIVASELLFRKFARMHLFNTEEVTHEMSDEAIEDRVNSKYLDLRQANSNARCFMAIEVENASSRKHLLGGAVNAATLGKIGVAVGFNEKMHVAFLNLYRYFNFLASVGKPTFQTRNLLIISHDQLLEILL